MGNQLQMLVRHGGTLACMISDGLEILKCWVNTVIVMKMCLKTYPSYIVYFWGGVMVSNATFNNISVILWQSVLLVEETGVPGEYYRPAASHWQTLSHNIISSTPCLSGIWTQNVSDDRHWLHR